MELHPKRHPTSFVESHLLDLTVSYMVGFPRKETHFTNPDVCCLLQMLLWFWCDWWLSVFAGCCCRSCSLTLSRELSPESGRLKRLLLRMRSITAPTFSSSSSCWLMPPLTHSGSSRGESECACDATLMD